MKHSYTKLPLFEEPFLGNYKFFDDEGKSERCRLYQEAVLAVTEEMKQSQYYVVDSELLKVMLANEDTLLKSTDALIEANKFHLPFNDLTVEYEWSYLPDSSGERFVYNYFMHMSHPSELARKQGLIRWRLAILSRTFDANGIMAYIDSHLCGANIHQFKTGGVDVSSIPVEEYELLNPDCMFDAEVDCRLEDYFGIDNALPGSREAVLKKNLDDAGEIAFIFVTAAIVMFTTKGLEREIVNTDKLNKRRVLKGKPSMPSYTFMRIGKVYGRDGKEVSGNSGIVPKMHLRAGHLRWQWYGPFNTLKKQIWIDHCIVNFDPNETMVKSTMRVAKDGRSPIVEYKTEIDGVTWVTPMRGATIAGPTRRES